jgi:hypothetical protein
MRETKFRIRHQGDVEMAHCNGYLLAGNDEAVCFYIDPSDSAHVSATTYSRSDCPVLLLIDGEGCENCTEIEFTEFPGWRVHAAGGGKSIAVALVNRTQNRQED